jgi:DNA-binding MarR family transcriptional regulator
MKIEEVIKTQNIASDSLRATINLIYTSGWLLEKHSKFFKKFGLTHQQFNALRILKGQYPNPATVAIIRDRMLDKMSDASRIVDRLIKQELVIKTDCKKDKRSVDIVLSEKGLTLLNTINSELYVLENLMTKLSDNELQTLSLLLDKLRG